MEGSRVVVVLVVEFGEIGEGFAFVGAIAPSARSDNERSPVSSSLTVENLEPVLRLEP